MKTRKFMNEVVWHIGPVLSAAYILRLKTVLSRGNDLFINMMNETTTIKIQVYM
jgi:hypothetical protein